MARIACAAPVLLLTLSLSLASVESWARAHVRFIDCYVAGYFVLPGRVGAAQALTSDAISWGVLARRAIGRENRGRLIVG